MAAVSFKRFDVRKLLAEGGAPFPAILKRLAGLKPGEGLAVIAPLLPSPLIEKLRCENYSSRAAPQPDGSWITYFWQELPAE